MSPSTKQRLQGLTAMVQLTNFLGVGVLHFTMEHVQNGTFFCCGDNFRSTCTRAQRHDDELGDLLTSSIYVWSRGTSCTQATKIHMFTMGVSILNISNPICNMFRCMLSAIIVIFMAPTKNHSEYNHREYSVCSQFFCFCPDGPACMFKQTSNIGESENPNTRSITTCNCYIIRNS